VAHLTGDFVAEIAIEGFEPSSEANSVDPTEARNATR
jgi:hypothetical protein